MGVPKIAWISKNTLQIVINRTVYYFAMTIYGDVIILLKMWLILIYGSCNIMFEGKVFKWVDLSSSPLKVPTSDTVKLFQSSKSFLNNATSI